jgi:hypothetical protein
MANEPPQIVQDVDFPVARKLAILGQRRQRVLQEAERALHEVRREALQLLRQLDEEAIGVVAADEKRILAGPEKLVADVRPRLFVLEAHPVEEIVEALDGGEVVEDRIVVAAVTDDDPRASLSRILK